MWTCERHDRCIVVYEGLGCPVCQALAVVEQRGHKDNCARLTLRHAPCTCGYSAANRAQDVQL